MNIVATYRFGRSWGGKHNRTPTDTLLEAWLFFKNIFIYIPVYAHLKISQIEYCTQLPYCSYETSFASQSI